MGSDLLLYRQAIGLFHGETQKYRYKRVQVLVTPYGHYAHGIYCETPSYIEILLTNLKSTSVYVSLVILQSMNSINISLILIMLGMDINPNPGPPISPCVDGFPFQLNI